MKKKDRNIKLIFGLPIIFIIAVILIIIWKGHINSDDVDFNKIGNFGSFIGGVIGVFLTIVASMYVYLTYHKQKKELKSQKTELTLQRQLIAQQQFESTFFNMLNVHGELKNGLKLNLLDFFYRNELEYETNYNGVDVFEKISKDYILIYNNLESLHYNLNSISNNINKNKLLDPQYLFSLSEDMSNPRPITLANQIDCDWDENNNNIETHKKKILFTYDLLFENYQNILSHYCRNVYHILKFIRKSEENDFITIGDKTNHYKQYANILQSQLNVNEHFILFYNFISFFNNDEEKEIFFPINILNHYQFLENIGIDNIILNNHKKQYEFNIKGDN